MTRILVVQDDEQGVRSLVCLLESDGYEVERARSGPDALQRLCTVRPDLIILDVLLPGHDGFRVLRTMRDAGDETPALMLSARRTQEDKVRAFRLGADDYVTKPFGSPEVLARVGALLRRSRRCGRCDGAGLRTVPPVPPVPNVPPPNVPSAAVPGHVAAEVAQPRTRFGDVEVDRATRVVRRGGRPVALAPKEYALLLALMDCGAVAPRAALLRQVWGDQVRATSRTVDMHVAELRRKLERVSSAPQHILTVRKVGYRFER
jgi:two-component system response regulator MtrA